MRVTAVPNTVDSVVSTDWLLIALLKHCIVIAVQKSCINASAVAVFVEWWIVTFLFFLQYSHMIAKS